MAPPKKRRKAIKLAQKTLRPPTAPPRPRDGDRRRRGLGMTCRQGIAEKRAMQAFGALVADEDP